MLSNEDIISYNGESVDGYKNVDDFCAKENKTLEEVYGEINNLPSNRKQGEHISVKGLPFFLKDALCDPSIDIDERIKFYDHFASWYIEKENNLFRLLTDKCVFFFVDGKYEGVFNARNKSYSVAFDKFMETTNDILLVDMYPRITYEYKECCLSEITIDMVEEKYPREVCPSFETILSFDNVGITQKYTVDSGCSTTHMPYFDYLTTKYKYIDYPHNSLNEIMYDGCKLEKLPDINNSISFRKTTVTVGINEIKVPRKEIFFRQGFMLKIKDLNVSVKSLNATYMSEDSDNSDNIFSEKIYNNENMEIIKRLGKSVGNTVSNLRSSAISKPTLVRPTHSQYLLGMNVLSKLSVKMTPFLNTSSILSLDYSPEHIIGNCDTAPYTIISLKPGVCLYDDDSFVKLNSKFQPIPFEFLFNTREISFYLNPDGLDSYSSYKTNRKINMVIIQHSSILSDNFLQSVDQSVYDGYIVKNESSGNHCSFKVNLKDITLFDKIENKESDYPNDINVLHSMHTRVSYVNSLV